MIYVGRRQFITLVGGAAAWPLVARAQQPAMPVVGFVYPGAPELSTGIVAAFRKGLGETGFVEGRNVVVEFRFAYNDNARLPELVNDLVRRRVAVIVTLGSTPAALAAKAATTQFQLSSASGRTRSNSDSSQASTTPAATSPGSVPRTRSSRPSGSG
jgi:putative tryptophan/tyrosine transport system substrate-binding protein